MLAARYETPGAPGVLRYEEVPDPTCAPGGILIEVYAISIEGGDLVTRAATPVAHPHIVGVAASGVIVQVGTEVHDLQVGDAVTTFGADGSHATLRAVPRERAWLIPPGCSFQESAALLISFGTADHCLFRVGQLGAGETVLVQAAAGGVGLAAVQLATRAGATVLATVSGELRADRLRQLGAQVTIDYKTASVVDEVLEHTNGVGADLVIDPVGSTIDASLTALRPRGRLVFVGNAGGGPLTADLWRPMQNNQHLHGVFMGTELGTRAVRDRVTDLLARAQRGDLRVVIDREFPLRDAAGAHAYAENTPVFGRVVMVTEALTRRGAPRVSCGAYDQRSAARAGTVTATRTRPNAAATSDT